MVQVGTQWNDGGDLPALGDGRTGEDGEVPIAGEVAGPADAVHHGAAQHVRGVDVAEDVGFQRRVHGDDPQPADDFRIVGDLLGAQHQVVAVALEIAVQTFLHGLADGERTPRGELHLAGIDQVDHGVLDDLRVHLEGGDVLGVVQRRHHGVGDVADARLDGQEFAGDASCLVLAGQERRHVGSDLAGDVGELVETLDFVGHVVAHHAHDLVGIDPHPNGSDAVARGIDGDALAVRRVFRFVDVVDAQQLLGVGLVEFDDDLLGHARRGGDGADAGSEEDFALGRDVGGLHDGHVDAPERAGPQRLLQLRQVHVEELGATRIQRLAEIGVGLVGGAELDGIGSGELPVQGIPGGGSRDHADLERTSLLVFRLGLRSDGTRNDLGGAGGGESRKSDRHVVLYQAGGFGWIECREGHRSSSQFAGKQG